MSNKELYTNITKKKYEAEAIGYTHQRSLVGKFTNVPVGDKRGNEGKDQLPESIFNVKTYSPEEHSYSSTMPMLGPLLGEITGGSEKMESNELELDIYNKPVFWQTERTAVKVSEDSAEGDVIQWTGVAKHAMTALKNRLVRTEDKRFHASIYEADPLLSTQRYWKSTPPVSKKLHPSIYANSKTKLTWNGTYSTYETTITSAADALTDSAVMNQAAINNILFIAGSGNLEPCENEQFGFNYAALLSPVAYEQLITSSDGAFLQQFRDGGERAKDNIGITGEIGVYNGLLIMKDHYASVFDIGATAGSRFKYAEPTSASGFLERKAVGSAVGTCELTPVFGKNAIGKLVAGKLKLNKKFFDYDFSEGLAATVKYGYNRMEFLGADTTVEPTQCKSFVYMTVSKDALSGMCQGK